MSSAIFREEYFSSTNLRPFRPIASSSSTESCRNLFSAFAVGCVPISVHQPQWVLFSSSQGVPLVVITGVPEANASATTIPKFSEKVGNTNISASWKSFHFWSPYTPPQNCIRDSICNSFVFCFSWAMYSFSPSPAISIT